MFEVLDEGGGGLVHDFGLHGVGVFDVGVGVPVGDAVAAGGVGAVEELDDADAFFEEFAGEDAVLGVFFFEVGAGVGAVEFVDGCRFVFEIHGFGDGDLHFSGEFVGGDAGGEVGVVREFFEVVGVEAFEDFGGEFVVGGGVVFWSLEVGGWIFGVEVGALEGGGEEAVAEVVFSGAGEAPGVVDGDEGGEVAVIRAEGVGGPGAEGGEAFHGEAGVHEVFSLGVGGGLGVEGVDEAEVVGVPGEVGDEV